MSKRGSASSSFANQGIEVLDQAALDVVPGPNIGPGQDVVGATASGSVGQVLGQKIGPRFIDHLDLGAG